MDGCCVHRGFDWKEHLDISPHLSNTVAAMPNEGGNVSRLIIDAAASLSACDVDDPMSIYVLRLARGILRHCSFYFGLFECPTLLPLRAALIGLLVAAF